MAAPPRRRRSRTSSSKRFSSASLPTTQPASSAPPSSARPGAAPSPTLASAAASTISTAHPPCSASSTTGVTSVSPTSSPQPPQPSLLAAPDRRFWRALDCRHGRAIFLSVSDTEGEDTQELLVWEPITGAQQRVPVPAAFESVYPTAAVFCAAGGCDHSGCHGGPFRVVFVFTIYILSEDGTYDEFDTSACVYSSETGTWGELTSMHRDFVMDFTEFSSVLVGNSLLYFMADGGVILEYDLARHALTVIDRPIHQPDYGQRFNLMLAEDGGLGLIMDMDPRLKLWSRNASARWLLTRVINLGNSLPFPPIFRIRYYVDPDSIVVILGFAEGANVIFFNTVGGLFTLELQSERVKKVCDDRGFCNLIPVVRFYTPVPHAEHQGTPLLNPIEEAAGEERGGEQENAMEPFVNTCLSHALEARSAPNEESLKGTNSKDDAGNSITSASNAESALRSENDLEQRILKQQDEEEGKRQHKEKKEKEKEQACQNGPEEIGPDVAAMMSFSGFGTTKK